MESLRINGEHDLVNCFRSWASDTTPSIGRPITSALIRILDRYLRPVPIGVPWEIGIGGPGLRRGYPNLRDLTADKFIPNRFSEGQPLYRTGDLGRHLSNGNIDFLGRADHQVKVRGCRIELGRLRRFRDSIRCKRERCDYSRGYSG